MRRTDCTTGATESSMCNRTCVFLSLPIPLNTLGNEAISSSSVCCSFIWLTLILIRSRSSAVLQS